MTPLDLHFFCLEHKIETFKFEQFDGTKHEYSYLDPYDFYYTITPNTTSTTTIIKPKLYQIKALEQEIITHS